MQSIAVTLEMIKDKARCSATGKIHPEKFHRSVFKEMVRSSGGFQVISQEVIEGYKQHQSHKSMTQVTPQSK